MAKGKVKLDESAKSTPGTSQPGGVTGGVEEPAPDTVNTGLGIPGLDNATECMILERIDKVMSSMKDIILNALKNTITQSITDEVNKVRNVIKEEIREEIRQEVSDEMRELTENQQAILERRAVLESHSKKTKRFDYGPTIVISHVAMERGENLTRKAYLILKDGFKMSPVPYIIETARLPHPEDASFNPGVKIEFETEDVRNLVMKHVKNLKGSMYNELAVRWSMNEGERSLIYAFRQLSRTLYHQGLSTPYMFPSGNLSRAPPRNTPAAVPMEASVAPRDELRPNLPSGGSRGGYGGYRGGRGRGVVIQDTA